MHGQGKKTKKEAYTYCQVQLGRINFREHAESDL
jgi:ribosomal protein S14